MAGPRVCAPDVPGPGTAPGGLADRLRADPGELRRRYEVAARATGLADLLRLLRIEYQCPLDARRTPLADRSVDGVVSSNVFENVPPDVLAAIHREACCILRPGGVAVHRINPGDHFSFVDRSITEVNFLRYGRGTWWWYGGAGLAYHNRLRCVEHGRLLREAGFVVRANRTRLSRRSLEEMVSGRLRFHPDFQRFTPEELAADYVWLVGEKPAG